MGATSQQDTTMPVISLPEDKIKILFYGQMMFIQNFGFFLMYYLAYGSLAPVSECTDLRFWVGFFALDCFVESFVCVWMALAGYTDDGLLFPIMWVLHLLVALPYCLCTVTIPVAMFSEDGQACRRAGGSSFGGYVIKPVFWLHLCLFMVYVFMMLAITYFSYAKATFFGGGYSRERVSSVVAQEENLQVESSAP